MNYPGLLQTEISNTKLNTMTESKTTIENRIYSLN